MLWRAACDPRAMVFPPLIYNINASLHNICLITTKTGCEQTEEKKVSFTPFFPLRRLRRADSMYVYHYTLAFEPDFTLEQRSTL